MWDVKHRAKIKNASNPDKAEWLYGYASRNKQGQCFLNTENEEYIEVEEESIGKEIGFYDKNGKSIFVGDILKVEGSKRQYIVKWSKEELAFIVSYKYANGEPSEWVFSEFSVIVKQFEVIGNTYENSELIK